MANEIMILGRTVSKGGKEQYHTLFVYDVHPLVVVNGVTVVETPSDGLPEAVTTYALIPDGQKQLFDNGSRVFELVTLPRNPGETAAQMLEKLKRKWTSSETRYLRNLRKKYEYTGQLVNV
jgi:hypothetical protein